MGIAISVFLEPPSFHSRKLLSRKIDAPWFPFNHLKHRQLGKFRCSCGNRMSWYLAKFSCVCRRCYEMWCSNCIDYGKSDVTMDDGKSHKVCPDCYERVTESNDPYQ